MKYFIFVFIFSINSYAHFDHSHSIWNNILKSNTLKKNSQVLVDYKKIKTESELLKYLQEIENLKKEEFLKFSIKQKLSFWINIYNAYTVKLIVDNFPVKSIKEIKDGWFSFGPWKKRFIPLFGEKYSLDQIEHEIIRKEFSEPRIHFAVNCASIGCPSLFQEAFIASKLDVQLEKAAFLFLKNRNKNFIKNNVLYISKIFKWFGEDFEKVGGVKKYMIRMLKLPKKDYDIKYNDYDWSLNNI